MVFESDYTEWDDPDHSKRINLWNGYNDEKEAQKGHYKTLEKVKKDAY